jgi:hypothetical protein
MLTVFQTPEGREYGASCLLESCQTALGVNLVAREKSIRNLIVIIEDFLSILPNNERFSPSALKLRQLMKDLLIEESSPKEDFEGMGPSVLDRILNDGS